jgi:hypothetical protein
MIWEFEKRGREVKVRVEGQLIRAIARMTSGASATRASPRSAPTAPRLSPPCSGHVSRQTARCAGPRPAISPLQHERITVLDRYFIGIETKVIDKPVTFNGAPLSR